MPMTEFEFVAMSHRLLKLAAEECEECQMGLEPEKVGDIWLHPSTGSLCKAPLTHDRISTLESEYSGMIA